MHLGQIEDHPPLQFPVMHLLEHVVLAVRERIPPEMLGVVTDEEAIEREAGRESADRQHGQRDRHDGRTLVRIERAVVPVLDVGLRRPTLDDVFLTLTGHAAEVTTEDKQ